VTSLITITPDNLRLYLAAGIAVKKIHNATKRRNALMRESTDKIKHLILELLRTTPGCSWCACSSARYRAMPMHRHRGVYVYVYAESRGVEGDRGSRGV